MSRANRESIAFIEETTWGTTPSTPTGKKINFTTTSLAQQNQATNSQFIRDDTNVAGVVRTGTQTGGDVGVELQYGGYDSFMEGALRNTWATAVNITATDISFVASDNSINSVAGDFTNVVAGQWLKVSGTSSNNGYFAVQSKTSDNKIIIAGATLTDESAGASMTIKGAVLSNSNTDKSYTIERDFDDITQHLLFTGCRVGSMALSFGLQNIAGGSFNFLGKSASVSGSTVWNSVTAAETTQSMNTVNDIKGVFVDGVALTTDLAGFDFTITTNAEQLNKLGSLEAAAINTGSIGVTGTITEYFEDAVFLGKNLDFTKFRLSVAVEDEDGNAYVFDFPHCRITSGSPDNGGINQTISTPMSFTAALDSTLGYTASVTRVAA